MVYNVLLKRHGHGYVATVQELAGVEARGATREETLADVRAAIDDRLSDVEIVKMEVNGSDPAAHYSAQGRQLALETARRHGVENPVLTGKPWIDFAGHLSHLPDEYWEIYDAEMAKIRAESDQEDGGQ